MPFRSVIWMWSCEDRLLLFDEGVTLTLTDGRRDSAWLPFPPSKYSINNDVCDLFELRPWPSFSDRLRRVAMVTGLPSSGKVYSLFSVSFDSSSVPPLAVPPVLESVSVGAGSGGTLFLDSTIMTTQKSTGTLRGCMRGNMVVCCIAEEEAGMGLNSAGLAR